MYNIKTLKEAVYRTIHHHPNLSVEAIAEELNISANYLARAALPDPDMDGPNATGVRFPLKQLIPLIRVTEDYQVLDFIEHSLGRVAIPIPRSTASLQSVQVGALRAAAEFGELMKEIADSCEDGKITLDECTRIHKEGWEAISAIMKIIIGCEDNNGSTKI